MGSGPVRRRAVGSVLLGGALLGSVGTASSYAPASATSGALGGFRVAAGAIVLFAAAPLLGGSRRGILTGLRNPRIWVLAACTAAFQPLFLGAVDRAGVALSALLAVGVIPVSASLLAWVALGHRPTGRWLLATALAVIGLVLRSWGELDRGDPVGIVMAVAAAIGVGCYVVTASVELDRGTPAIDASAGAYLLAAVLLAPLVVREPISWALTPAGIVVIVYLGAITMGIGNLLSMHGLRHLDPAPAATLMLADPLVATVLGLVVLHEGLDLLGAVGVALVAVGLVLQARAT